MCRFQLLRAQRHVCVCGLGALAARRIQEGWSRTFPEVFEPSGFPELWLDTPDKRGPRAGELDPIFVLPLTMLWLSIAHRGVPPAGQDRRRAAPGSAEPGEVAYTLEDDLL
jgi:hypothetical protein